MNLEGPLTRDAPAARRRALSRSRRRGPAWLQGRVDVVSLANNHALDQGAAGRDDTVRALAGAGVAAALDGHDAVLVDAAGGDGARRAPSRPRRDLDGAAAAALVAAVARAARPTLVSLHWGHTGLSYPATRSSGLARAARRRRRRRHRRPRPAHDAGHRAPRPRCHRLLARQLRVWLRLHRRRRRLRARLHARRRRRRARHRR